MAYSAGDPILDDEYNTFVNSSSDPFGYNHFAGTGSTVYGLGQTHIATQAAGDTITAAQWNALFTGMDNVANHTNDSIDSTAQRSAGDPIAIKTNGIDSWDTIDLKIENPDNYEKSKAHGTS